MPVTYGIDGELGCVHTRCAGEVTLDEIVEHFQALAGDATLPRPLDVLLDLSELRSLPAGGQLVRVAAEVRRVEGRVVWGACAVVAPEDMAFGAGRMFARLTEPSFERTSSFRDLAAARAWLASQR